MISGGSTESYGSRWRFIRTLIVDKGRSRGTLVKGRLRDTWKLGGHTKGWLEWLEVTKGSRNGLGALGGGQGHREWSGRSSSVRCSSTSALLLPRFLVVAWVVVIGSALLL